MTKALLWPEEPVGKSQCIEKHGSINARLCVISKYNKAVDLPIQTRLIVGNVFPRSSELRTSDGKHSLYMICTNAEGLKTHCTREHLELFVNSTLDGNCKTKQELDFQNATVQ